jgi:pyrroline-5-carboxylate reductase
MLQRKKLAILGAGKIGETLIKGLLEAGVIDAGRVLVTTAHPERAQALAARLGVRAAASNVAAASEADVVLLAVKPKVIAPVAREIREVVRPEQLVISVAASVRTAAIERELGPSVPVVRAMPNTPCSLKQGMTAVCAGAHARPVHTELARALFAPVGRVVTVDEAHMDSVTGLSASGPAFVYIIIESLAEAGVKVGLPRELATELAAQTVLGAASMVIETGEHPARLKDAVTTPAGCTIDGILELEEGGLRVTLIKAVVKAAERARALADG